MLSFRSPLGFRGSPAGPKGLSLKFEGTGFFRVEKVGEFWWLVDPEGKPFFSIGVNAIRFQGDHCPPLGYSPYGRATRAKYGRPERWAVATARRLRLLRFNTVGSWSDPLMFRQGFPYTVILNLGRRASPTLLSEGISQIVPWMNFPDVFHPDFARNADKLARACERFRDDPMLLGYFLDNEFWWEGLWEATFSLPSNAPAKRELAKFVSRWYGGDKHRFREEWRKAGVEVRSFEDVLELSRPPRGLPKLREAWNRHVAETYFKVLCEAVRRHDPNHLILGHRFAGNIPPFAVEAAGRFCDVISINFYNDNLIDRLSPRVVWQFGEISSKARRPILITEWSFKALDSGLPNTKGAGRPVLTQVERARGFASFSLLCALQPHIVGLHWFKHSDQPHLGRFDGENSNYGLVNLRDDLYPEMAVVARFVNGLLGALRERAMRGNVKWSLSPGEMLRLEGEGARCGGTEPWRLEVKGYGVLVIGSSSISDGRAAYWARDGESALARGSFLSLEGGRRLEVGSTRGFVVLSSRGLVGGEKFLWARLDGAKVKEAGSPFIELSKRPKARSKAKVEIELLVVNPLRDELEGEIVLSPVRPFRVEVEPRKAKVWTPPGGKSPLKVRISAPLRLPAFLPLLVEGAVEDYVVISLLPEGT
ncbi:MAG TPA: hypothetical protein EYP65_05970 [Armatimonadetes bacterium]|nr:hypothetical protein [Armatimonadota bacterium]